MHLLPLVLLSLPLQHIFDYEGVSFSLFLTSSHYLLSILSLSYSSSRGYPSSVVVVVRGRRRSRSPSSRLVGVKFNPPHTRLEIRNQMRSDLCEVFYLLWVGMIMVAVFGTVVVE